MAKLFFYEPHQTQRKLSFANFSFKSMHNQTHRHPLKPVSHFGEGPSEVRRKADGGSAKSRRRFGERPTAFRRRGEIGEIGEIGKIGKIGKISEIGEVGKSRSGRNYRGGRHYRHYPL